jgi:uncharacterized protein (TIGR02757 family)
VIEKDWLEDLYDKFNDRKYVHPDPLEFLYEYEDLKDRELVGLIASSLAYGRVLQILKSVGYVLNRLGKNPHEYLINSSKSSLYKEMEGFKHRFTTDKELVSFLLNIKEVIIKYGTIGDCFKKCSKKDDTILPTLLEFIKELRCGEFYEYNSLIPKPDGKCAYKRMNLYLRWMIRKDNVDPGGWDRSFIPKLLIPLDIHMYNISVYHQLTKRKQANMKTALEITASFRKLQPSDPVKYDFALTRENILKNN